MENCCENEQSMQDEKYIVWGCGEYGRLIVRLLQEAECRVIACCDKNREIVGNFVEGGTKIIDILEAKQLCEEDKSIEMIIAMKSEDAIKEVREELGCLFHSDLRVHRYDEIRDEKELFLLKNFYCGMQFQYKVVLEKYFDNWLTSVLDEVRYWIRHAVTDNEKWEKYYQNHRFRPYEWKNIEGYLQKGSVVMEIGTGLYPFSGEVLSNGEEIQFIPVDALAPFYNKINRYVTKDQNIQVKEIEFGMFEFMSYLFDENYADMLIINNALDHCVDALRSIVECLYILKVGGRMYLGHRRAEAVHEVWSGMHQWNIDCIAGDFVIWNKENAVNVSRELKDIAEICVTYNDTETNRSKQFVEVEMIKKRGFRMDEYVDREKDAAIMARCIKYFMSLYAKESKTFVGWLAEMQKG